MPLELVREHVFEDASVVRLPGESRAAQIAAFDELAPGLGQQWVDHVARTPTTGRCCAAPTSRCPGRPRRCRREVAARLDSREMLHQRLKTRFKDERLRQVAAHPFVADGHDPRNVPAWAGLVAYLEQRFGAWTVAGGMGVLAAALTDRLATRGVTVETGVAAQDVVVREGRVVGVRTSAGEVDADVVVVAVDPRRLPALASYVERTMPAMPPVVVPRRPGGRAPGDLAAMPHETVLHGDPMLVVRTGGSAPTGHAAWTVHGRGRLAEDILLALARHGIDVRAQRRRARRPLPARAGRALGRLAERRALAGPRRRSGSRLGPTTPIAGVYAAGAHATPGGGLPFVGLSAALVAQAIGPA